jgi:hypothetical protein
MNRFYGELLSDMRCIISQDILNMQQKKMFMRDAIEVFLLKIDCAVLPEIQSDIRSTRSERAIS